MSGGPRPGPGVRVQRVDAGHRGDRGGPGRAAVVLTALALPLIALVLAIQVLASGPYLRWTLTRPGYPADPAFTTKERLALALPSTVYIVRRDPPERLAALEHRGAPLYTAAEVSHLEDVRRVIGHLRLAALLLALAALAALAARPRAFRAGLTRGLRAGSLLLLGFLAGLALAVTLAWNWAFTTMHRVFFAEGTWQFSADSALIRLFPDAFWYDTAVALVGLMALQGLAALLLGRRLGRG